MKRMMRKTAPKVRDGKVQRKNRWRSEPDYTARPRVMIERRRPGAGYRHVVRRADVFNFLQLVPKWEEIAIGLNQISLDRGNDYRLGWFRRGEVAICGWPVNLKLGFDRRYFYRDLDFFRRLDVPYEFAREVEGGSDALPGEDEVTCWFTPATARCFALMRTLLHEFGHHFDLMTNPKNCCSRGEDFAEGWAREIERRIWPHYCQMFGDMHQAPN
jgi:hypothetical protein